MCFLVPDFVCNFQDPFFTRQVARKAGLESTLYPMSFAINIRHRRTEIKPTLLHYLQKNSPAHLTPFLLHGLGRVAVHTRRPRRRLPRAPDLNELMVMTHEKGQRGTTFAIISPIPLVPPVTSAILFLTENRLLISVEAILEEG
jgi:hypothetical protein